VTVCAPSCLRTARDHVGIRVECGQGCVSNSFDLFFGVVMDAQAVDDTVDDKDLLLLMRGRGEKVARILDGEALSGVGGVGERCGVPDVVGIGGVKFCMC
jgi:hypothetical protein